MDYYSIKTTFLLIPHCPHTYSPDLELSPAVGLEEHGLGSQVLGGVGPLDGRAGQLALAHVLAAGRSGHLGVEVAVAGELACAGPVTGHLGS